MFIALILVFGFLIGKLAWVQLVRGEYYQEKALATQLSDTMIEAQRGTIYDSNMNVLVQSATVWKVFLDPSNIDKDKGEDQLIASELAKDLEMKKEEILEMCGKDTRYVVVKDDVEYEAKQKILDFAISNKISDCIGTETSTKRFYSSANFAATVLGFCGSDGQGLEGIEAYYNEALMGTAGRLITAKNAQQGSMPNDYETVIDANDGDSLVLTIDDVIQYSLDQNVEEALKASGSKNAYGIVMDVHTGAVLGMSNKPDFNSDDPWTIKNTNALNEIKKITDKDEKAEAESAAILEQWRNKTITDTYEPGSVFKIITAAAALEEGIVDESYTYTDTGKITVEDRVYNCHVRTGHGTETFSEALQNSCNTWFINLGQKLGVEKFYKYFEAFGMTEATGIDLPGEATPVAGVTYHEKSTMGKVELASESFGQSFQVSPIQMITAVSAVANGGKLMKPYIVKEVLDNKGSVISTTKPVVKRTVISEKTAASLRSMLEDVVTYGTGKNAYLAGYHVAGKTGTSEKLGTLGDDEGKKYVTSFVCFAPADNPEVAVLICCDEPQGDNPGGGTSCAPYCAAVLQTCMEYYNVQPQYSEDEMDDLSASAPDITGKTVDEAYAAAESAGLELKVVGEGKTVQAQSPQAGRKIPKGGQIIVYTDEKYKVEKIKVPDFKGMNVYDVNATAIEAGLNVELTGANLYDGNSVAAMQSIAADTVVEKGTVIKITFISSSNVSDT